MADPIDPAPLHVLADFLRDHGALDLLTATQDPVKELLELRERVHTALAELSGEVTAYDFRGRPRTTPRYVGMQRVVALLLGQTPPPRAGEGIANEAPYEPLPTTWRAFGVDDQGNDVALRFTDGRVDVPPNVRPETVRVEAVDMRWPLTPRMVGLLPRLNHSETARRTAEELARQNRVAMIDGLEGGGRVLLVGTPALENHPLLTSLRPGDPHFVREVPVDMDEVRRAGRRLITEGEAELYESLSVDYAEVPGPPPAPKPVTRSRVPPGLLATRLDGREPQKPRRSRKR